MRRIAVSGHRGLGSETAGLVGDAVRAALRAAGPGVTGLSCLAEGADQIFARAVLELGGRLEAIIPALLHRDGLPRGVRAAYDHLLERAGRVHKLPVTEATAQAHMAAGEYLVTQADELWAVWDGLPARGLGGTGDVVAFARARDVPVRVIWPSGASRD
jgi:hypothetical protein